MKKALILALALGFLAPAGLSAQKAERKEAVTVFTLAPAMTCKNCENKVKTNIRFEKGVNEIITDLKAQTVTVKYNPDKTDKEQLKAAFKKIGYTATEKNAE